MPTYKLEVAKSALKELKRLPAIHQARILRAINELAKNPRKGNVRPMVGSTAWRLRIGNYRVIYDINDKQLFILIIRIRHRKDVYKK